MTALHAAAARLNSDSAAQHTTPAGLKADGLRLQGIAQVYQQKQAVPDVVERYAATHSGGGRLVVPQSVAPRPPDVSDAALAARYGSTATASRRLRLERLGDRDRHRDRPGAPPRSRLPDEPPAPAPRADRLKLASANGPSGPLARSVCWTACQCVMFRSR